MLKATVESGQQYNKKKEKEKSKQVKIRFKKQPKMNAVKLSTIPLLDY